MIHDNKRTVGDQEVMTMADMVLERTICIIPVLDTHLSRFALIVRFFRFLLLSHSLNNKTTHRKLN